MQASSLFRNRRKGRLASARNVRIEKLQVRSFSFWGVNMVEVGPYDEESNVKAAANCLKESDVLFVSSGAGMGVDSGLGTFRGRN